MSTYWHYSLPACVIFLLWGLAFLFFAGYPSGPDEQMHMGYMLYQHDTQRLWPDFNHFPVLTYGESSVFKENYLNHPPYFYAAAYRAATFFVGENGSPEQVVFMLRLMSLGVYAISGLLGLTLMRTLPSGGAWLCGYSFLLLVVSQLGYAANSISNDTLAIFAAALCLYGGVRLAVRYSGWALGCMALGVMLAGSAKLTVLILCGVFSLFVVADIVWRKERNRVLTVLVMGVASLIACAPYLYLLIHYGEVTPSTPGHLAMQFIANGYPSAEKYGFFSYVLDTFMNVTGDVVRPSNGADMGPAIAITRILLACSFFALFFSVWLGFSSRASVYDRTIAWGCISILFLWIVALTVGYQRYLAIGVRYDIGLRYFLPFVAVQSAATIRTASQINIPPRLVA